MQDEKPDETLMKMNSGVLVAAGNGGKLVGNTVVVNPLRSLAGKIVFLDLNNSYKSLEQMKECLRLVGASVAECFSKEVQVVISNRGKSVLNESNTNHNSNDFDKKQKTPPNSLLSRSRSLIRTHAILENASKSNASSDVVSTAMRLGIKVMNVNELERYVDRYKKKSMDGCGGGGNVNDDVNKSYGTRNENNNGSLLKKDLNVYKLKAPYLKFESICKQYRPIYKEFKEWHELNLDPELTKKTISPFQIYCSDNDVKSSSSDDTSSSSSPPSKMLRQSSGKKLARKSSKLLSQTPATTQQQQQQQQAPPQPAAKRKNVFCECCRQRFENIKQHLASSQHENFERNAANFKEIDEYVNGVLNFERFLEQNDLKVVKKEENNQKVKKSPEKNLSLKSPPKMSVKERKRNMSITYEAYETLREAFEKNQDPTDSEINQLAAKIITDPDLLKKWFTKQRKKVLNASILNDSEQARSNSMVMKSDDEARSSSFTLTLLSSKIQATPQNATPAPQVQQQAQISRFKLTPNRILANFHSQKFNRSSDLLRTGNSPSSSSISLSSPSAALILGISNTHQNNSFSMPSQMKYSNAVKKRKSGGGGGGGMTTRSGHNTSSNLIFSTPGKGGNNNTSANNIDDLIVATFTDRLNNDDVDHFFDDVLYDTN